MRFDIETEGNVRTQTSYYAVGFEHKEKGHNQGI